MRSSIRCRELCFLLTLTVLRAEVIDRIAVTVGNSVITASDVDREIRVTSFLNGVKPDFSSAAKRATANRMVEQKLIRRELETSRYPVPNAAEVEPILQEFKKAHFKDAAEYERAMTDAGVTEQGITYELLWQRTLLLFIEIRFRPGVQVSDQDVEDYFEKVVKPAAQAAHPAEPVSLDDYRTRIEETLVGQREDTDMDKWLTAVRKRTEIVFHDEALR